MFYMFFACFIFCNYIHNKKKSKFVFFLAYEENCVRRKITSQYPRGTHPQGLEIYEELRF